MTISTINNTALVTLDSPLSLPQAGSFLWNKEMMLYVNCRGFVNAQFMQPEPSKYSYAANIEAKTFMQPEQKNFTHSPGRFFYIKDEASQQLFSVPYEPVKNTLDKFSFQVGESDITWLIEQMGLEITIKVSLAAEDVVERWSFSIKNLGDLPRSISIYPYFTIGYMSWMNQSASFNSELNGIVASAVTPYQKVEEYFKNKALKDKTYFIADKVPTAWHANQVLFEGEGGLHNPDALLEDQLSNTKAWYETPVAVMQYQETIVEHETITLNFLFGPATDEDEIKGIKNKYFGRLNKQCAQTAYVEYVAKGKGCLSIISENKSFDNFVNHWLPRQMFYHGDVNRLSTDPQTRNYVQDNMGMSFINPETTRQAFIKALSQQQKNGAMPDGILLHDKAELKYINQIPHTDHCVWLPICLTAYLNETGDTDLLNQSITFADSEIAQSFLTHIELALDWLLNSTDYRGLSFIKQGDWCDPMNMVGYKGKGVSAWLSLATAYAVNSWCDLCEQYQLPASETRLADYRYAAKAMNESVNKYLYHGDWFARGITDDGRVFGTEQDLEGKIYLNPQSWALLSGAANAAQQEDMIDAINDQLMTPQGVMMLAPSYTAMVEDIGRVTQKSPGVAENGSVYNHAAIFYAYSLYQVNEADAAFEVIEKMLPSYENASITGQLPVYVPNYYRGAYHQFPDYAGRSSHLFNTGTISWLYRCLVEELCGLKGGQHTLYITPKLPKKLNKLSGQRRFRGAVINFMIEKSAKITKQETRLDGEYLKHNQLDNLVSGEIYQLEVRMPFEA